MSDYSIENLPWLLRQSPDFREQLKTVQRKFDDGENVKADFQAISARASSPSELRRLGKMAALSKFEKFRVALVAAATSQTLSPALVGTALRYNIHLDLLEAEYNQVMQNALIEDHAIAEHKPELIVIDLHHTLLSFPKIYGSHEAEQEALDQNVQTLTTIINGYSDIYKCALLLCNFAPHYDMTMGNLEPCIPGSHSRMITLINQQLYELTKGTAHKIFDTHALASSVGISRWSNPTQWYTAKLPVSNDVLALFADHICRTLAAIRGKTKKVLVLDLDNTLWGGVIGDDGVAGIRIGQNDPISEAYLEVQRAALAFKNRGVILAICSKNDKENAVEPFEKHEGMLLKLDDITVFTANWTDKATNIEEMAKILNLGLDSFVFLDDNPVERAIVREALPMVAVPEIPADPSVYALLLRMAGYFDLIDFTVEDAQKTQQYKQMAETNQSLFKNQGRNLESFLDALNMVLTVKGFDTLGLARIVQLINKTNQFNLTTRRYTQAQVEDLASRDDVITIQAKLTDKFGDNGMVSVVILKQIDADIWEIDTWLMSCRVLKRQVEQAMLNLLCAKLKEKGVQTLKGIYIPTEKNNMVKGMFEDFGFTLDGVKNDQSTWSISTDAYTPYDLRLEIIEE